MQEKLSDILENFSAAFGQQLPEVGFLSFVLILVFALTSSLFISYLYLHFYSSRATGSHIHLAFPLLGISVTAIFLCIQFSLPLSLGLLGALSIVRFRTPIKEPEEIGFIMLVIAASLACATFNMLGLVAILGVALVALLGRRYAPALLQGASQDGSLIIAFPEEQYTSKRVALFAMMEKDFRKAKVESISKNDDEIVVTFCFRAAPPRGLVELQAALGEIVEPTQFTVLYNRPGAL